MTMPVQKPGRSEQSVQTPNDFMEAVVARFGPMAVDLAADASNRKCPVFLSEEDNSLNVDWHRLDGNLWLNPPFEKIDPWAQKAAFESQLGANVFMLVPASVGSNWYRDFVEPYAYVFAINPRLKFVGHKTCYPKCLVLAYYSSYRLKGFDTWRWKP
jgi:phage N-6-adenine-methyltransferase